MWHKAKASSQSEWPGPQGHGDSIGMADHRAARLSPFLLGRKARIQGPPIGPWPTAVRKPHGPTARPSLHPRESQGAARCAIAERSEGTILTRRAETRNVALFMSSAAIAKTTLPFGFSYARVRVHNAPRYPHHVAMSTSSKSPAQKHQGPRTTEQRTCQG